MRRYANLRLPLPGSRAQNEHRLQGQQSSRRMFCHTTHTHRNNYSNGVCHEIRISPVTYEFDGQCSNYIAQILASC